MKLGEWCSTCGSKYHIGGGMFAAILLLLDSVASLGVLFFFGLYQIFDAGDDQQRAWDLLEIGAGYGIGCYILLVIKICYMLA